MKDGSVEREREREKERGGAENFETGASAEDGCVSNRKSAPLSD